MNLHRYLKIFFACVFAMSALLIAGCDGEEDKPQKTSANFADAYDPNDTWLVYWYVCGSDLESDGGAASGDIEEMLEAKLPDNVKVLIQAGGANEWHNAVI